MALQQYTIGRTSNEGALATGAPPARPVITDRSLRMTADEVAPAAQATIARSETAAEALRVTAEEVALAAAALEAKRDQEYAWRENSIPLGEAIRQIGLNASVEELAPEVHAMRAARVAAAQAEQSRRITRRFRWALAGGFSLLVAIGILRAPRSLGHVAAPPAAQAMTEMPIQKLSSIPDNTPVHVTSETLASLAATQVDEADVSVDTRSGSSDSDQAPAMFTNEWTVVKTGDGLQVRGWATAEFALNIANNGSGAMLSSRPGWVPASDLTPIQVPVYRLEGQQFARYLRDGNRTDSSATSVLMGVDVIDRAAAAKALVESAVLGSSKDLYGYGGARWHGYSYVDTDVKKDVVHLEGNATSARLKKLAGDVAVGTLTRLRVPYTVSNDLVISQDPQ